jgi:hypothetical protein
LALIQMMGIVQKDQIKLILLFLVSWERPSFTAHKFQFLNCWPGLNGWILSRLNGWILRRKSLNLTKNIIFDTYDRKGKWNCWQVAPPVLHQIYKNKRAVWDSNCHSNVKYCSMFSGTIGQSTQI